MEVTVKNKVDWDDDDPYAIPPEHLPKIKGGKLGGDVEVEEPEHHSKKKSHKHHHHESTEEVKNTESQPKDEVQEHHDEKEKHEKKSKHNKTEKHETETNDFEAKKEKTDEKQHPEYDPLQHPPKKSEHLEVTKEEALYPSLHEIVKHVDEETTKAHPEKSKSEPGKKHKNREGHESCKKCIIQ